MSILSTVTVDAPAHANYRLTWVQPVIPSDLTTDWVLVATGQRVSRFRIDDRVWFCSVRTNGAANAGTVTWDIGYGGPATAEVAYTGVVPNLLSARLNVTGQTGATYVASIGNQAVEDVLRDSAGFREVRRWTHTSNAADLDLFGDPQKVHGVHTYLAFRDDTPCMMGAIRVTNASITVSHYGAADSIISPSSFYGRIYFNGTTLNLPAGYSVLFERPFWNGNGNLHLPRMGYVRRFVIYPNTTPIAEAQALLVLKGHGVVLSGRSYLNTETYMAHGSMAANLDYPSAYAGGFAGLNTNLGNAYNTLLTRSNTGQFDPNADNTSPYGDFWRAPLGPFRPIGDWNALPPGVTGTAPDPGMAIGTKAMLYWRLFHDHAMEGSGYWCLQKTTGRPVTTVEFGQAAIGFGWPQNPNGICPENNFQNGNPNPAGRMPFHYNVQGYSGTNSSGIPGLSDAIPGQGTTGQDPVPYAKPLMSGSCSFEQDLQKWRPRFAGSHYIQHLNRIKILAYQLGDLVAIDDCHMMCENAAYAWSEVGALENIYFPPGNYQSLKDFKSLCQANPQKAMVWLGREAGWVAESYALSFAFGDTATRARLLPRLKMMHDTYIADVSPSGAHGRQSWSGQQGIFIDSEAWTPPSDPGDPTHAAPAEEEVFSTDIQADLFLHGLFCICRQLKLAGDVGFSQARAPMVKFLREIMKPYKADGVTLRWSPSEYQTPQNGGPPDPLDRAHGPAKYTSTCTGPPGSGIPNGGTVLTFFDVLANPNVLDNRWYLGGGIGITYSPHMLVMLWRLTGQTSDLNKIKQLGIAPHQWPSSTLLSLTARVLQIISFDTNPYTQGEFTLGLTAFAMAFDATGYIPEDAVASVPTLTLTPGVTGIRIKTPDITLDTSTRTLLPSPTAIVVAAPSISVSATTGNIVIHPGVAGVRLMVPFQSVSFATVEAEAELDAGFDFEAPAEATPTASAELDAGFDFVARPSVYPPADEGGDGDLPGQSLAMLQALLPLGRAWNRAPESVLTHLLEGFADELAELEQRALDLKREADPRTTNEMLTDWEAALGLPDNCSNVVQSIAQRRAAIVARLTKQGGQSPAFMKALALSLGFTVDIVEYSAFRCGHSRTGQHMYNPGAPFRCGQSRTGQNLGYSTGWPYAFAVVGAPSQPHYFRTGAGRTGENLATYSNALLECAINRAKPAHMLALFIYSIVLQPDPTAIKLVAKGGTVSMQLTLSPTPARVTLLVPSVVRALILTPPSARVTLNTPAITVV
jgi:uncharacterized protein YmfQ (DUF2313 family)